ncbi:MAG: hypothetical protein V4724_26525 [Pseudomonadota bacterium]
MERAAGPGGVRPKELDVPDLPFEVAHLWGYFLQMNAKRTSGMAMNPLSDEQVMAWQRRHRIALTPFENECIDALDEVFMASAGEEPKK